MTTDDILNEIKPILTSDWSIRDGRKVPDTEGLNSGNDGVKIKGTVLYADMVDSTDLVNNYRAEFAAEIYKSYLLGACRVIRNCHGEITAFDGDRVMAVFIGDSPNSDAAKAALQINHLVVKINEVILKSYPTTSYKLKQRVGIDVSDLLVAKTGIRSSNDLVWVGRAANYAAKLAALADDSYPTYITDSVFEKLNEASKKGGTNKSLMWEKRVWTERQMTVYRSEWWWKF